MMSCIALGVGIVFLLFLIIRTKIHAFPALIITSVIMGLLSKLSIEETLKAVTGGFGGTLGSIGVIIGFGCIMGKLMEESGGAKKMAVAILRLVGIKRADVVVGLTGLFVSVPVFCDSGFVILSQLAKEFSRITRKSMVGLGGILGMGLYITHFLVPPTPGPLAVAGFFNVDLGLMILGGILLSIPLFLISILYFRYVGSKHPELILEPDYTGMNEEAKNKVQHIMEQYSQGKSIDDSVFLDTLDSGNLPGTGMSFAPIVIPIVLILLNTICNALGAPECTAMSVVHLFGHPIVAVFIGVLLSVYGLNSSRPREECLKIMQSAMADAGLILLVTGAGGALGNVIRVTGIGNVMAEYILSLHIPAILVPLLMGAMIRIPQGSGTVAMITSGSILAPMLSTLGLDPLMAALAVCTTAMFISYPNDSYFWVVTNFSGMDVKTSLKTWTPATALIPVCGALILIGVNHFFF
jgi:GntP family gluconate:H+ symporter